MEDKVKQMYTEYTYPNYDEYMDKYAPIPHQYSPNLFLEQLNYYNYNGTKNFNNYSILVAGVGLGSDLINMEYILKKYDNIKIVGIDLSPSSLKICKSRIDKYNFKHKVELIEMSLLDLDPTIHGTFDLIICIGVLHHLENPKLGLESLKNVLKDDGCINIMVYGKYGRTGIYQMQDLIKKINYNVDDFPTKISNFKNIYGQLPVNNWFKLGEHLINDHKVSDEGIVDLILHHQDRSYSIPELYEFINDVDLNIVEFSPENRYKYKYEIPNVTYLNNIEKYSINELFFGDIKKHTLTVSKNINTKPIIDNLNNILILVLITKQNLNKILEYYKINKSERINIDTPLNYEFEPNIVWATSENIKLTIEMNDIIYTILDNIDNKKTIKEIFDIVRAELDITTDNDALLLMFKPIYYTFELYDLILITKQTF